LFVRANQLNVPSKISASWVTPDKPPIRVMLVDDSLVARSIFRRILQANDQIEITCEADSSASALESLRENRVDIVLLDIEMPNRSGLDALPELLAASHGARILVVSSFAEENGPSAIQALSLGACDTLAKPGRTGFGGRFSEMLLEKVVRLGQPHGLYVQDEEINDCTTPAPDLGKPECIAIGASTGGIPAIFSLINNLSAEIDCPIFITQHLPDAFMVYFARQLTEQTKRSVQVAEAGMEVRRGQIYLAPGEAHLVCRRKGNKVLIGYLDDYVSSRYCPSVDAMFESVAAVYGGQAIAIVLSGMGNDGAIGARFLVGAGAQVIVQDSASSVIWGMPGSVVREGLASAVMSPDDIGRYISNMVLA
jgi:two-component system chemotaxis response regulator CheB